MRSVPAGVGLIIARLLVQSGELIQRAIHAGRFTCETQVIYQDLLAACKRC